MLQSPTGLLCFTVRGDRGGDRVGDYHKREWGGENNLPWQLGLGRGRVGNGIGDAAAAFMTLIC